MKKKHKKAIKEILEQFSFRRVHDIMLATEWTWNDDRVPEIYEIKTEARRILRDLYKRDLKYISTGGFHASRDKHALRLLFVVEEWCADL